MNGIITSDETGVYGYDPETRCWYSQCMSPEPPRPNKARQCIPKSAFHCMVGTVNYEYFPEGQQWINITVLKFWSDWGSLFVKRGQKKRDSHTWAVQNDKAPAHISHSVQVFFLSLSQIMSCLWFKKHPIPWHGSLRLLAVHPNTKRKEIRWQCHQQREHNEAPDDYSERLILKMFPTMAEMLASMCGFRRRLFWRGLTICCCKQ